MLPLRSLRHHGQFWTLIDPAELSAEATTEFKTTPFIILRTIRENLSNEQPGPELHRYPSCTQEIINCRRPHLIFRPRIIALSVHTKVYGCRCMIKQLLLSPGAWPVAMCRNEMHFPVTGQGSTTLCQDIFLESELSRGREKGRQKRGQGNTARF